MKSDLKKQSYSEEEYKNYILGSAEVVGLMCLRVFTENDEKAYNELTLPAMRLGSAFQKINFLRDLREDSLELKRVYFPDIEYNKFCAASKQTIENDIQQDFDEGYKGIKRLPKSTRFGVYLAYVYYKSLFNKIKKVKPEKVMTTRIRIPNTYKIFLLCNSYLRHNLNLL
jgi:phytoene synthase